jgi:hypothetical protein
VTHGGGLVGGRVSLALKFQKKKKKKKKKKKRKEKKNILSPNSLSSVCL